jgi:hypothetical protein
MELHLATGDLSEFRACELRVSGWSRFAYVWMPDMLAWMDADTDAGGGGGTHVSAAPSGGGAASAAATTVAGCFGGDAVCGSGRIYLSASPPPPQFAYVLAR